MSGASTPVGASFRAIGTVHHVMSTDAGALGPAIGIVADYLRELDRAASRFRPDSEVSRLARMTTRSSTAAVSAVLVDHVQAALHVARLTGGLVDPTVGRALVAQGYDDDIAVVRARTARLGAAPASVPGWRTVRLEGSLLTVVGGTLLDLGAIAKAHAADVLAGRLATRFGAGFLVSLGGDVAVAGDAPDGGWRIGVDDSHGELAQVVTSTGQAIATSSVVGRAWATDRGPRHHVVDPRTGRSAETPWAQVTCAARTAAQANAAATAALVLGADALPWLRDHRIHARLEALDGQVTRSGGWPAEDHPELDATVVDTPASAA